MSDWKDYVEEVRERGFEKASPLARLIWSCEVGQIDQHASIDLKAIAAELATQGEAIRAARDYYMLTKDDVLNVLNTTIKQYDAAMKLQSDLAALEPKK